MRRSWIITLLITAASLVWSSLVVSCATGPRAWPMSFAPAANLSCTNCHGSRTLERESLGELCTGRD